MKRWIVGILVVCLLGAVGWEVYRKATTTAGPSTVSRSRGETRAVAVETAAVLRGPIRDVRLFTGSLLPKSRFVLAPKVSGRLESLSVQIGDPVQNGQLIAVLDSAEYEQQLEQARADLQVAGAQIEQSRTQLENARREYDRIRQLHEKNIVSASELDQAESEYKSQLAKEKVTESQLVEKQAALKAAEIRLSYTKIHVSWEGNDPELFVGERFVDEGAMLNANAPIVSIVDVHSLIAAIYVIERDYPNMRVAQEAIVATDAFPGRTFAGKIIRIAPVLKEESRQARVEIDVPNPERLLKPGMFVRVSIELARHENALLIPYAALVKREQREGVFAVDLTAKTARFVPLTVGIVNGETVEVLDPAIEGPVVTLGRHLLVDGSAVLLAGEKPAPSDEGEGKAVPGGDKGKPQDASGGKRP